MFGGSPKIYKSKFNQIGGSNFSEVSKKVNLIFKQIKSKTKRRPYVKSLYFNKSKIFISQFFSHTFEKNWRDATRRLKLFECGIDLIKNLERKCCYLSSLNNFIKRKRPSAR